MKISQSIGLIACVFTILSGPAQAAEARFAVSNATSLAVVSIELRSQDRADIQPAVSLVANVVNGEQQDFVAGVADGACLFTAVFVMADGSQTERSDLDLCEYSIIAIE